MARLARLFPTSTRGRIIMILLLGAIVLAWSEGWFRDELDRWRLAAARQTWLDGDRTTALRELGTVIERRPDRLEWVVDYARRASDAGDYEAAIRAVEAAEGTFADPPDWAPAIRWEVRQIAAYSLIALGRGDEAIAGCRPFAGLPELKDDPSFLNGYAYLRALAGVDLDGATADIERVLEAFDWPNYELSHRAAITAMDAGDWGTAADRIDRAIGEFEPIHRRFLDEFEGRIAILGAEGGLQEEAVREEIARLRTRRETLARRRALMHAHRSRIREQLGDVKRAEADREQVRRLGFDPELTARLRFADGELLTYAAYLDTKAWILFRAGNTVEAERWAARAVSITDLAWRAEERARREAVDRIVRNEEIDDRVAATRRGVAALHYHLAEIYRAVGKETEAAIEEGRVRELGFEPGPTLF
jgi:tetratricopeptide (TPR) repeat protein